MTGPIMLQLLEAAVKAVNTPGLVINLPTVWGAMVANELQAGTAAAREVYTSTVNGFEACYTEVMAEAVHKVGAAHVCCMAVSTCSTLSKQWSNKRRLGYSEAV
jgi:hypothetical protein